MSFYMLVSLERNDNHSICMAGQTNSGVHVMEHRMYHDAVGLADS